MKDNYKIVFKNEGTRGAFVDMLTDTGFDFNQLVKMENPSTTHTLLVEYISEEIYKKPTAETFYREERWSDDKCYWCDGKGEVSDTETLYEECDACNGYGSSDDDERCDVCDGDGTTSYENEWEEQCDYCYGTGKDFGNTTYKEQAKELGFKGIAHYDLPPESTESGKWETHIFLIYDCGCPCSDTTIATLIWN